MANQRILSRYLTEKCKIWGLGRYFTPSSMGKKCPSSDSKSCSKGRYFWQNRRMNWLKKGKGRTIKHEYESDECRLFYTYTSIARLHTPLYITLITNALAHLIIHYSPSLWGLYSGHFRSWSFPVIFVSGEKRSSIV